LSRTSTLAALHFRFRHTASVRRAAEFGLLSGHSGPWQAAAPQFHGYPGSDKLRHKSMESVELFTKTS
jgi:hypothetical protein